MQKTLTLIIFIFTFFPNVLAQDFCNGDHFFDSGGINNDYQDNEVTTTTITPESGETVTVTFISFDVENNFDFLNVHDGPNDTFPLIAMLSGNSIPNPITSTDLSGSLTFVFSSDGLITKPGWEASIECTTISCFKPTNLSVVNLIGNNIEVDWTDNNTTTPLNGWEIAIGEEGFNINTVTPITVNTNPYTINNVNLCSVDIYVRAVCNINDFSLWSDPLTIQLPSDAVNAPFYESFDTNTTPSCWYESGSEPWNFNLDAAYDAEDIEDHTQNGETNYAWIDGSNPNGVGQISNLKTPWIDISNLTVPNVLFSVFSLNNFENTYNTLDVVLHELSGVSTNILHLQGPTNNSNWENYDFNISSLISDTVISLEFIIEENSPNNPYHNDILIDDIKVRELPTCPAPQNVNINNIEIDSAIINWSNGSSESNWEIEYGFAGFTQGDGIILPVNTHPYQLNNLDSGSEYHFYLRANCGASSGDDDSEWTGPYSFITAFDYCNGDHFYDSGGEFGNYSNNENTITVITPDDADIVTVTFLTFDLASGSDTLEVFDGPNITSPSLGIYTNSNLPGPFTSTHDSGSLTFRFISNDFTNSSGWDATVFCEVVSCPRPSDISISNITPTSGLLNWNNGGSENAWEIEFGPFGFTQGTGTTIFANSNPFIVNGLEQGTKQQAYIRANCSDNDDSNWSEVLTFVTPCGSFDAPFYENFEANDTPGCWYEYGDEFWNYSTDASFTASNAGDFTFGGGTNYAYIDGSSPTGSGHISNLITPWIDISNLQQTVIRFHVFSQNDNDQTYNTLDVILHQQNGTDINILHLQNATNGWQNFVFIDTENITIDSQQIQLEFIVEENSSGNSFFNDILIDDIIVEEGQTVGTEDFSLTSIEFYPNPVQNNLIINTTSLITNLVIYDTLGKVIYKDTTPNKYDYNIDFSNYTKGIYFIKVFTNNQTETLKIIKQ